MKVLVACEFSRIVAEAFEKQGHDVTSCDLLPAEKTGKHYQGDVMDIINDGWDIMMAFPPCTYLAVSGARWWETKQVDQRKAIYFFLALANANIPKICVENPIGIMSTYWRKPDQIIQPWMFGEDASKATCLWLKGLPLLQPTEVIKKERYANQTPSGQNKLGPSPGRSKLRSITYPGIANAMAERWGRVKTLC